jgi:DNA-binding response OmpR family regulator
MTARVLIVEDEERIQRMLKSYLEVRGFVVRGEPDAVLVPQTISDFNPDVLLLDWGIPGKSGIDLLRELRANPNYSNLPVIMVSARSDELDRVEGLLTGADDYVVKPFNLAELEARIGSVLRRAGRHPSVYIDPHLEIYPDRKRCTVEGHEQSLTQQEWLALEKLLLNPEGVKREDLTRAVWGESLPASTRAIDNVIMRLRKAFGDTSDDPRYIVTEWGNGYRFVRRNKI